MKIVFIIEIEAANETVFAPGADYKFLTGEIMAHALKLWTFYAAGPPPDVSVRMETNFASAAIVKEKLMP